MANGLLVLAFLIANICVGQSELLTKKELRKATVYSYKEAVVAIPSEVYKIKLTPETVDSFLLNFSLFTNLQSLDMSKCNLDDFPNSITKISTLQELIISYNPISSIPNEIGDLSQLKWLYANFIKATTFPSSIKKLTHLHTLYLWGSELTHFPPEIEALKSTLKLINIRSVKMPRKTAKALRNQLSETKIRYSYKCDCDF